MNTQCSKFTEHSSRKCNNVARYTVVNTRNGEVIEELCERHKNKFFGKAMSAYLRQLFRINEQLYAENSRRR